MGELSGFERLMRYLDAEGGDDERIHHARDFRATATAHDTHTPADEFAKTVFVRVDGEPAMAVVPADRAVAFRKLRRASGDQEVSLLSEVETRRVCPDCEVGAAPPFGNLYGMRVYVSDELARHDRITFNGGTHEKAFRVRFRDYERLAHPEVVPLARDE
jgi:Ala-tRNA(Pro) deacylase